MATWLFEGWPDDEALETMTLAEELGVTTMTDVLRFKDRASLGDHFRGDLQVMQTSYDQLEDFVLALAESLDDPSGNLSPESLDGH